VDKSGVRVVPDWSFLGRSLPGPEKSINQVKFFSFFVEIKSRIVYGFKGLREGLKA